MISSALVKEKPETVPAGFVSEALILRSELISYNSNSFRINCRSVTKAERTFLLTFVVVCQDLGVGGGIKLILAPFLTATLFLQALPGAKM